MAIMWLHKASLKHTYGRSASNSSKFVQYFNQWSSSHRVHFLGSKFDAKNVETVKSSQLFEKIKH